MQSLNPEKVFILALWLACSILGFRLLKPWKKTRGCNTITVGDVVAAVIFSLIGGPFIIFTYVMNIKLTK